MSCPKHKRFTGKSSPINRKDPEGRTCEICWQMHYNHMKIPYDEKQKKAMHRVHTIYKQETGDRVQGVTTVISNHNGDTGGMTHAAWKLGVEGINYREEWAWKRDRGSLVHDMIRCFFQGITFSDWARWWVGQMVDEALEFYKGFEIWWAEQKEKEHELILIEEPLVSEKYRFGGTADMYWKVAGKNRITDHKTGKDIYWNHLVQLAALAMLFIEKGYPVDEVEALQLYEGGYHSKVYDISELKDHARWFLGVVRVNDLFNRVAKGWGK